MVRSKSSTVDLKALSVPSSFTWLVKAEPMTNGVMAGEMPQWSGSPSCSSWVEEQGLCLIPTA